MAGKYGRKRARKDKAKKKGKDEEKRLKRSGKGNVKSKGS